MPVIIENLDLDLTPPAAPATEGGLPPLSESGAASQLLPLLELLREREERLRHD